MKLAGDSYNPFLIEASFTNLINNGVLSKHECWYINSIQPLLGNKEIVTYQSGNFNGELNIAFYTDFTKRFVRFVNSPEDK